VSVRNWTAIALLAVLLAGLGVLFIVRRDPPSTVPPRNPVVSSPAADRPASADGLVRCAGTVRREANGEALEDAVVEFLIGGRLILGTGTDSQGRYEVSLAPETYEIRARLHSKGMQVVVRKSHAVSGGTTLDISLPVGPAISGTVETWDGRILSEVSLEVDDKGRPVVAEKRLCRLGPKGEFRVILERAEGASNLFAVAKGYPPSAPLRSEFVRDRDLKDLRLKLDHGGGLEGQVVNESTLPVPQAKVRLEPVVKPAVVDETSTDEQGRFRFPTVRPGEYFPRVEAEGYVTLVSAEAITIGPGDLRRDLVLRVNAGWRISGKVVDGKGNPVPGCLVQARESGVLYHKGTDRDGAFLITGIAPGKDGDPINKHKGIDSVTCLPKEFGYRSFHDVAPGGQVTFVLASGGSLEVKISLSDGEVLPQFPWTVGVRLIGSPEAPDRADDTIHLREGVGSKSTFGHLAPGVYSVQVNAGGRNPVNFERVAVREGDTTTLQATLVPGQPDAASVTFEMGEDTDPEQFRIKLTAYLEGVDKERLDTILEEFLEDTKDYPALHRIVLEIRKKR
jgi:protocatechuate 3,4-dioxygenase beta subunit